MGREAGRDNPGQTDVPAEIGSGQRRETWPLLSSATTASRKYKTENSQVDTNFVLRPRTVMFLYMDIKHFM